MSHLFLYINRRWNFLHSAKSKTTRAVVFIILPECLFYIGKRVFVVNPISEKVSKIFRPETRYSSTFWRSIWYFNYKRYKAHTESVNSSVSGKKYIILINCQEKKVVLKEKRSMISLNATYVFFSKCKLK